MKTFNLFTYGTILKGNHNHIYVSNAEFLGDAHIKGFTLFDYVNAKSLCSYYPVALKDNKSKMSLIGEVYKCPYYMLAYCDSLEGEGILYSRETITVDIDNKQIKCYIYVGIPSIWINDNTLLVPYDMSKKYRRCQYEIKK